MFETTGVNCQYHFIFYFFYKRKILFTRGEEQYKEKGGQEILTIKDKN